ncbi:MAG: sensor histidine kinase [Oligoflexus sp.]
MPATRHFHGVARYVTSKNVTLELELELDGNPLTREDLVTNRNRLMRVFLRSVKWMTHPIVVFVSLQIVWLAFVILWIIWFVNQKETVMQLSEVMGTSKISGTMGVMTLVVGSVLLGIILVGTIVLFVFTQIQGSLLRQQKSFVSSVTHELRSPLSSIQLSFETFQRPNLPPEIHQRLLKMIQTDIERLTQLVDRILISSRLDRGIVDFTAQVEVFSFSSLMEKMVEQASHLDVNLAQRLRVIAPKAFVLRANRLAMHLILGNLVENAIKYSPPDSVITIEVHHTDQELLISVHDHGLGLNKRDLSKIFQMFHRSPRATKNAVPGTGLGLYIVRSMVRGLGGRVWAESPGMNQGSTFYVTFPDWILANQREIGKG